MRRALAAAFFSAVLLAACRGEEDGAGVRERLQEKGTPEVIAEVAKARYAPPADGRLSEVQVRMYLEVKERGRRIREVAAKDPRAAGGELADLRAALELGRNPKEFTWVGERIAEAHEAEAVSALEARVGKSREAYLAMLEEERKAAADAAQRAEIDRQIAEFRNAQAARTRLSPAVRYNIGLLSRYRGELDQIRLIEARLAAEERREEGGR
jgi:hypothetical protein